MATTTSQKVKTKVLNGYTFKVIKYQGSDILVDDPFDMLDDLLKSTTILVTDFSNTLPLRVFKGKFDNMHESWLVGGDKASINSFFFSDEDGENLLGGMILQTVRKGDTYFTYYDNEVNTHHNGYSKVLFICDSNKLNNFVY